MGGVKFMDFFYVGTSKRCIFSVLGSLYIYVVHYYNISFYCIHIKIDASKDLLQLMMYFARRAWDP